MKKIINVVLSSLILIVCSSELSNAQTVTNIVAGFNVEKGVIEISYDLDGLNYQGFSLSVKLKQLADNVLVDIPVDNISPSLELVYPGTRKKFEIGLDGLSLEGEFLAVLNATPIAKPKPVEEPKPAVSATQVEEPVQPKNVPSTDTPAPTSAAETTTTTKAKTYGKYIRGFSVSGASWADLGNQIKQRSEEFMQAGNLQPVNIRLNLATQTFSCDFVENETGFIKLGLYFGSEKEGCISCERVLDRNPSSKILRETSFKTYVFNLIAIHN
jgi:hypothetical protein